MAAKIWSALVKEIEKVETLNLKNKFKSMERKLEELENIESKYLAKRANLLQLNANALDQLNEEKQFLLNAQSSYVDHDMKLDDVINKYAISIKDP